MTELDPILDGVRQAAADVASARERFEARIRAAWPKRTFRQIASAAGLSAGRIHQIVKGTK